MTTKELINQYVTAHADNRWMDASELETLLTEFAEKLKEPASEDLKKEIEKYFAQWYQGATDEGCVNSESQLVSIYDCKRIAKHFAQWQREQMMKDAIECNYRKGLLASGHYLHDLTMADFSELAKVADRLQLRDKDKVKVLIIKE